MRTFFTYMFFLLALSCGAAAMAAPDTAVKVKWGYKGDIGPARWAELNNDFRACAAGKQQSPVNIPGKLPERKHGLAFKYQAAPMEIVNDGTTALTIGNKQVIIQDGHGVQLNFSTGEPGEAIELNGKKYRLVEFHFHTPSETTQQKRSFPMEIHFVHQGKGGQLAVVGVFVKGGEANPELQKIIDHLPKDKGKTHTVPDERVNPANLIPKKRSYYSFDGSLTTPPCTEGVHWVVMSGMITASPSQIAALRKAMGGDNARPVQPLHDRTIFYSK